ncbi:MAG: hypothetical protein AB1540_04035 [Bdellovibrionota bacterium]
MKSIFIVVVTLFVQSSLVFADKPLVLETESKPLDAFSKLARDNGIEIRYQPGNAEKGTFPGLTFDWKDSCGKGLFRIDSTGKSTITIAGEGNFYPSISGEEAQSIHLNPTTSWLANFFSANHDMNAFSDLPEQELHALILVENRLDLALENFAKGYHEESISGLKDIPNICSIISKHYE